MKNHVKLFITACLLTLPLLWPLAAAGTYPDPTWQLPGLPDAGGTSVWRRPVNC